VYPFSDKARIGVNVLAISKWVLLMAGVLLIGDSILMVAGIPNPLFSWPLPCPITLFLLGVGVVLFVAGSGTFKRQK